MSRDLIFLAIAMFTWGIGEGAFLYFQPIYLEQLGASPITIGKILGGFGLAMTVSHLPAGYLADRLGRRPLIIAAWLVGTAAAWIMALADQLSFFVAGMLIYALTISVMSPLYSYITAARGRWSVARAITIISACFNLGAIAGPLLGGYIGDRAGLRQAYYLAGSLFLVSTFVITFIRSQPVERASPGTAGAGWLTNPRYLAYLGVIFLATFATYVSQPLSPNFLSNERGLSMSAIGGLYSTSSVGVVVLNLALGQLPARSGFLLAQAAVGVFAALMWLGSGLPWYFAGYFLLGGFKTARSLGMAQVRELASQAKMGVAYALTETMGAVAVILAPLLAGYIYTRNPYWMYAIAIVLILVSILASARLSPAPVQTPVMPGEPGGIPDIALPAGSTLDGSIHLALNPGQADPNSRSMRTTQQSEESHDRQSL